MDSQKEYVLSVIIKETTFLQLFYYVIFKRKNECLVNLLRYFITLTNTKLWQLLLLILPSHFQNVTLLYAKFLFQ